MASVKVTTRKCSINHAPAQLHSEKNMIIRNKRGFRADSNEIALQLSFTVADVRRWVQRMFWVEDFPNGRLLEEMELSEGDVIQCVANFLEMGTEFPTKYAQMIGAWAFRVAVREQMLLPSEISEGLYFVSGRRVLPRQGRKKFR